MAERGLSETAIDGFWLADWRRQVFDLYAAVRAEREPAQAHARWRETRARLFRNHPQSPIPEARRAAFAGLAVWTYDPRHRFAVELVPEPVQRTESWDIGPDGPLRIIRCATTSGLAEALGAELPVWWIGGYGGGLFVPFRDATSGNETYGAGRYVIDAIKGADLGRKGARLILDFNFAYHPSCAHAEEWVCPLAPPEAGLPAVIRAGERLA